MHRISSSGSPVLHCVLTIAAAAVFTALAAPVKGAMPAPLPSGVSACGFDAIPDDSESAGLAVRDAPRSDARVLARLPLLDDKERVFTTNGKEWPQFHVIGFKDGWFLIEGANYPLDAIMPKLYAGRGWVDGKRITTNLFRDTLKATPSNAAPEVVYLRGTRKEGIPYEPYGFETQIVGCSGPWLEVEISLPDGKSTSGKVVSPPGGMIRGWTDKSCPEQHGACLGSQFDYSWSPLPAGVTECSFGALIDDPDPSGLEVRAAPDRNAAVLGRVLPTTYLEKVTRVRTEVTVIGFRKGWFLVEAGPYMAANEPSHGQNKPYIGRGWVAGDKLTAELLRDMLKQGPSETSANVVNLRVEDSNGQISDAQTVKMRRILACSGDWVHVEIGLLKGMKPLVKTAVQNGAVRGWSNGTCIQELTTCDFNGDRPWSPSAPLPRD